MSLKEGFKGLSDRESVAYQVKHWVNGDSLHNTVRDECCPDFSCCSGGRKIRKPLRKKFERAWRSSDEKEQWKIMAIGIQFLGESMNKEIYVAGLKD